jgi:hypothetical protein
MRVCVLDGRVFEHRAPPPMVAGRAGAHASCLVVELNVREDSLEILTHPTEGGELVKEGKTLTANLNLTFLTTIEMREDAAKVAARAIQRQEERKEAARQEAADARAAEPPDRRINAKMEDYLTPVEELVLPDGRAFGRDLQWPTPAHSGSVVSELPCVVIEISLIVSGEEGEEAPDYYEILSAPIAGSLWAQKGFAITARVPFSYVTSVTYKEDAAAVADRVLERKAERQGKDAEAN